MTALGDFTAGDVLQASDLNAIGAWTSFTPTFDAGLTLGNAAVNFAYTEVNKIVHVQGLLTFGSTTSLAYTPTMTLPVDRPNTGLQVLGTGYLGDTGTGTYMMFPLSVAYNSVILFGANHTVGSFIIEGGISSSTPFTWTTGDRIAINLSYEAA
jgi:hypothetical protein